MEKGNGLIKFSQNAWLEPYIDINTDLRKKAKKDFEKYFFKLVNMTNRENMEILNSSQQKQKGTI